MAKSPIKIISILIATGIYPPDIGGPAKYAENLAKQFKNKNYEVKILSYKFEKKLPIGLRHIWYFLRMTFNLRYVDLIIALDTFSVGAPAALAAKIFNKKIIIRVGGDFLWETYVEKSGNLIKFKDFYYQKIKLPFKYKIIAFLEKAALKNVSALAFNTGWQKDFFEEIYKLNQSKNFIIENYYCGKIISGEPKEKNFLFAGRRIKLKNIKALEEVFEEIEKEREDIRLDLVDNLSHNELMEKIKLSYALIVPSISEFAPNFIIEGLSFNKPFILTKETGLYEELKDLGIFINPFDRNDIKNKILFLADEKNYKEYKKKVEEFNFTHSWQEIADEFLNIYRNL